ncbi:hypothetical protein [Neorhizobium galegae]|uniref:hypothetical protein n=1 Tax=Neorhizobium galegae TaxID=399 RepID=UPI002102032D|nr:hypothetical protein [Neorhizobium galegae]MCQ1856323.1 hypothetical protein [Neorhizobium galegae]
MVSLDGGFNPAVNAAPLPSVFDVAPGAVVPRTESDAVDTVPSHFWLSAVGSQFCMNFAGIPQEDNKTGWIFVIFTKECAKIPDLAQIQRRLRN